MTGLLRRLRNVLLGYPTCWAPGCGRPQIPAPSKWCRLHTDAILGRWEDRWPEVGARLAGQDVDQLLNEVRAGLAAHGVRAVV